MTRNSSVEMRDGDHKASCVRDYLSAMAALDAPTSGRIRPDTGAHARPKHIPGLPQLLLVADGGATAFVRR